MPPKKANWDEMEEVKKSLNFMSEELSNVSRQQKEIMGLMSEVRKLKQLSCRGSVLQRSFVKQARI